jgi:hypothetical protein
VHASVKQSPTMAEALADMAYGLMRFRRELVDPSLHDVSLAVVQCAPLFNLNSDVDAVQVEEAAIRLLLDRNKWGDNVVPLPRRGTDVASTRYCPAGTQRGKHHG